MEEETSKSFPIRLQPKTVFGLRPCPGNIHFTLEDEVIYTAAAVLVIHNYKTNKQKFLRFPEKVEISYVILSGNRKYLGLAETVNKEKTTINTYELSTFKKRSTIQFPNEIPTKSVASMSFTFDSKGVAILTKEPDSYILLVFFDSNQTQVLGRVSHSSHQLTVARCLSCSLVDPGLIAIGGDYTFKLLNKTEKGFAPIGSIKGDGVIITSLAFFSTSLTNDALIAGTDETELFIVESGDLKLIFNALQVTLLDLSNIQSGDDGGEESKKEMQTMLQERRKSGDQSKKDPVMCLTHFKNGFCYAIRNSVHVFRKEGLTFKKITVITIPITLFEESLYQIQVLAINQAEDTCLITCRHSQIYMGKLFVPESVIINELEFKPLGQPLHINSIIGMSTCAWKPIVITASKDQTIRIWNYASGTVELVKKYLVDIVVIALHPSGLFVAVGFYDQLRLMEILLDDLKMIKSYNFPKCKEAAFSNKGHLLAVSYDTTIAIVSVFTFDVLQTLIGHNGLILSLSWCADDFYLVSAGIDGAIYQWDINTGKRTNEVVQKGIQYRGVVTMQNNNIFAITNSGALREICKSEVIRETKIPQQPPLTSISLARSGLIMFISSESGHLFNVQLPFMETGGGTCTNFRFFNLPITKMCLTYDDNYLATASTDGTLVIWNILNNENRRGYMDEKLGQCTDVLISRSNLLDKIETVSNLEARICQQGEEFDYQFKQKEIANKKLVENIHKSYSHAIEELKVRNNELESEHIEELNLITAKNLEAQEAHQRQLLDMETEFHRKIIIEYEKNKELQTSFNKLKDESQAKLRKTAGYLEDTIESMESDFKQQIENRRERIQQLIQYNESLKKEFVEYCRQEKLQYERQLVRVRLDYEKRLLHEQEVNSKWRCEAGVLSKKFGQAAKENAKIKDDFVVVHEAHADLKSIIEEHEQEKEESQNEIQQLHSQISDKERALEVLTKRFQHLEESKTALEKNMSLLQGQLLPKEDQIRIKSEQMRTLEAELESLHRSNTELERILSGTRQKHEALAHEIKQKTIANHEMKTYLARVFSDIHLLNDFILQPEQLKKEVVKLHSKYRNEELTSELQMDATLFNEFQRQLDQVQKTKTTTILKKEQKPINKLESELLKDNCKLVAESEDLRKQLKRAEERIRNMEKLFRDSHKKLTPKEVKILIENSIQK